MATFTGWATALNMVTTTTGTSGTISPIGEFPGTFCSVYTHNTTILATVTPANPFAVNADGSFTFVGAASSYDLIFSITLPASPTTPGVTPASPLPVPSGGTGFSSYAVGDLLVADTTTTLAKLPAVALGARLGSQGVGGGEKWLYGVSSFSVLDYGAVGDSGVTDDGAAIALTYAAVVANGGGTLVFPGPRTYRTSLRLNLTTSHVTIEGDGSTILFTPADAVVNDRWLGISSTVSVALRPITGALTIGAASFVATNAGDVTDLVADDWLIVTEFDGVEPFAVDWVQVASVGGTTVTLRANLRTAFPGTHATVTFQRVSALTSDVCVRNLTLRMTTTPATAVTGITVGTARRVTLDRISARMLNGSGMSTYLAADLSVTNCQWQAIGLSPEFASTVDLYVSGCTFGVYDAAVTQSALLVDFGTAFFTITNNRLVNGGNILCQIAHGVHDGVFSANVLGWTLDIGIGVGQGLTGYGCTRVVVLGNILDGGTTGGGNAGIALITDTTLTPNVVSSGNVVLGNLIRGYTTPIPVSPAAADTYLHNSLTTGSLQIPNGVDNVYAGDGTVANVGLGFKSAIDTGLYQPFAQYVGVANNGVNNFLFGPLGFFYLSSLGSFNWTSGATNGTVDARVRRSAAKTIAFDDGAGGALTAVSVVGPVDAASYKAGGTAGIDTTITTASLVGKTITVTKGLITGFV